MSVHARAQVACGFGPAASRESSGVVERQLAWGKSRARACTRDASRIGRARLRLEMDREPVRARGERVAGLHNPKHWTATYVLHTSIQQWEVEP